MTMLAKPDVVIDFMPLTPGVIGENVRVTRTETFIVLAEFVAGSHVVAAQLFVVGGVVESQRMITLALGTAPKGATIRLTAAVTCACSAAALAGQTGPPAVLQLGSPVGFPIQLASTAANRAPSRVACDSTLLM